jgi:P2-related tail formation protein
MINLQNGRTFDLLPPNFRDDPKIKAFCYAIDKLESEVFKRLAKALIWSNLQQVSEETLDYLAAELRTPFYFDKGTSIERKRNMVLQTFDWYAHLGTAETVREIIKAIYLPLEEADAEIRTGVEMPEWFEYGGAAHTFKLRIGRILDGWRELEDLVALLFMIKNTRSWPDGVTMYQKWSAHLYYWGYSAVFDQERLIPKLPPSVINKRIYCGHTASIYERYVIGS